MAACHFVVCPAVLVLEREMKFLSLTCPEPRMNTHPGSVFLPLDQERALWSEPPAGRSSPHCLVLSCLRGQPRPAGLFFSLFPFKRSPDLRDLSPLNSFVISFPVWGWTLPWVRWSHNTEDLTICCEARPGDYSPQVLGQTGQVCLEANVFTAAGREACSLTAVHRVGLRPSTCAHPRMTSIPAWNGDPRPVCGSRIELPGCPILPFLLTHLVNMALKWFSHDFPGLPLTPQAAETALLTANGFLWQCSTSNINNQCLIKTKKGKIQAEKQTALLFPHLSPCRRPQVKPAETAKLSASGQRYIYMWTHTCPYTHVCIHIYIHSYTCTINSHTQMYTHCSMNC